MIETTTIISDVQEEFEGGGALAVNWDSTIRRAVENVLDNARPQTLKRRFPIYGGLAKDLFLYFCPSDVLVPVAMYKNNGMGLMEETDRTLKYRPPTVFYKKLNYSTFTIEYINGSRFLVVRHTESGETLVLDEMDAVGSKTGSPTLNTQNYLNGTGTMSVALTDAGVTMGATFTTAKDITDYLKGVAILPTYLPDASKLSKIEIRIQTDDSNYYSIDTDTDSISDYLINGWNMIKFNLANVTETGSPDSTDINSWKIIGTTDSGETMSVLYDRFMLQTHNPWYFEYYSNGAFVNGSTNAQWQTDVSYSRSDKINFSRDERNLVHYEMCMLITQSSTFDNVDSQATRRFEGQLKRAYMNYWASHPSDEQPLSYSKSPEIDINLETDFGRLQDDTEFDSDLS